MNPKAFLKTILENLPIIIGVSLLVMMCVFVVKGIGYANTRVAELTAIEAAKQFKVYCITSSGQVLFNETVNVANTFESGVYIKRDYYDKEYSTVITGQCRVDEIQPE